MTGRKILFQLSGSIACYKACDAISKLVQKGYSIQTVASKAALKFVGAATLEGLTGQKVLTDLWEDGRAMDHIHEVRAADLIILAPASANKINVLASGLGSDLISTMFLAHDFQKPYLIAPAMNHAMLQHPFTQKSLTTLQTIGCRIIDGEPLGSLACGESGTGRLPEPEEIVRAIDLALESPGRGKRILVTAGGTEVPIDSVRFIGNVSTGETGHLVALEFAKSGADVTFLISKKSAFRLPNPASNVTYETYDDFQTALDLLQQKDFDAVVFSAAVSDFHVRHTSTGKISSEQDVNLSLERNAKIINSVKQKSPNAKLAAFKLFSNADEQTKLGKRKRLFAESQCDFLIENNVQEWSKDHPFYIYKGPDEKMTELRSKKELAATLATLILKGEI